MQSFIKKTKDFVWVFLAKTPPRAHYNVLLNALGLNVARALFFQLKWNLAALQFRTVPENEEERRLLEDGIVVIPNFLPEEDFAKLKAEYQSLNFEDVYQQRPDVPQYARKSISTLFRCRNKVVEDVIVNNKRLRDLIQFGARKKINVLPSITFERFYVANENQYGKNSPERSDTLHYDVPYNSMRCFLYMAPCDADNAAFIYGKGTQRFNKARLKFEYYDSIKQAIKRSAVPGAPLDEIDEDLLKEIGHTDTDMVGKENTLVIFNSMGMHKRGKFQKNGAREAVLIDFRMLDTKANFIFGIPFIKGTIGKRLRNLQV